MSSQKAFAKHLAVEPLERRELLAVLYWDTNGVTPGLGGSGTWDATTANWSTSSLGNVPTRTWIPGSTAHFNGSPSGDVVTVAGTVNAQSLYFSRGARINPADANAKIMTSSISYNSLAGPSYISVPLDGSAGLTINGSFGTSAVFLLGDNIYSGGTTINNGYVQVGNGGSTGSLGGGDITLNNGILNFSRSDDIVLGGTLTANGGSISNGGGGTLTFELSGSEFILNNNSTLTLEEISGSDYAINNFGTLTICGDIAGENNNIGNMGTLTIVGEISGSNCTIDNSGELAIAAISGTGININNSGVCTVGAISGDYNWIQNYGTLNLTGVIAGADVGISTEGGTVSFPATGLGSSYLYVSGNATLQWAGSNNSTDISGQLSLSDDANITFDVGDNDVILASAFGDNTTAGIIKTGSGTLTLSGANTYTGATTLQHGILAFAQDALDATSSVIFAGGILRWESGNTEDISPRLASAGAAAKIDTNGNSLDFSNPLTGIDGLWKYGAGTLTLLGHYLGGVQVNAGAVNWVDLSNPTVQPDGAVELPIQIAFADPDFGLPPGTTQKVFSYIIDWGDGEYDFDDVVYENYRAPDSFLIGIINAGHIYEVEGNYTVAVTLYDADEPLHPLELSTDLLVPNAAPANASVSVAQSAIDEFQEATLTGTFTDAATDAHTVEIDWGDGSTNTTLNLPAGVFAIPPTSHPYNSNRPGNLPYTIAVTITDGDGASVAAETEIVVNHVPPTVNISGNPAVGIDSDYTLSVTVDHPQESILVVHWGGGRSDTYTAAELAPAGAITHRYADGPGLHTITVDMYDENVTYAGIDSVADIDVSPFPESITGLSVSDQRPDHVLIANFGNLVQSGALQGVFSFTTSVGSTDGNFSTSSIANGTIGWTPSYDCGPGVYSLTASFTSGSKTWSKVFPLQIYHEDMPPTFLFDEHTNVWTGHDLFITNAGYESELSHQFVAYGGTGTLTYDLIPGGTMPADYDFDDATGEFTWTYSASDNSQVYDFDVKASDSTGRYDLKHVVFSVKASGAPTAAKLVNFYKRFEVDSTSNSFNLINGNMGGYILGSNPLLVFDGGVTQVGGVYRTQHGTLDLSTIYEPNGGATYTPDPGFRGLDVFTYHWMYDLPNSIPLSRETNVARAEIQVGPWVDIQFDAPLHGGAFLLGEGVERQMTVTVQNPRGDGAPSSGHFALDFDPSRFHVIDSAGHEIVPLENIVFTTAGGTGTGGETTIVYTVTAANGSTWTGTFTVGGNVSAGWPTSDPEPLPIIDWPIASQDSRTVTTVVADIDTDSNNDGDITAVDDPTDDPTFEETAPGKVVQLSGERVKIQTNVELQGISGSEFYVYLLQNGSGKLKIYDAPTGGQEIYNGQIFVPDGDENIPSTLWVEGTHTGEVDLSIYLIYNATDEISVDTVKFTVANTWTRNEWKKNFDGTYSGKAIAGSPYDTLEQLAKNITGKSEDAVLLGNVGRITRGKEVDIAPLLAKLEERLRGTVTSAASLGDNRFANFPAEQGGWDTTESMNEAAVNNIFEPQDPLAQKNTYECAGMATIVFARGLIKVLNTGEFDALGLNPLSLWTNYLCYQEFTPLARVKLGDLIYIRNNERYSSVHPGCHWSGANAFKIGDDSYQCWNGPAQSYDAWLQSLLQEYNTNLPVGEPEIALVNIPGYNEAQGSRFLDVPKVGMMIFDFRIKPKE